MRKYFEKAFTWSKEWWRVVLSSVISVFNTELVVIPIILKGKLHLFGLTLMLVASGAATAEIIYWYFFCGWLIKKVTDTRLVREAISIGKEAVPEVGESRYVKKIEKWAKKYFIEPFDPKHYNQRKAFLILMKSCKYGFGLPMIFIFGLIPFPGSWIIGLIVCRAANWKSGFTALVLGNALKNMVYAIGWDYLWRFFK